MDLLSSVQQTETEDEVDVVAEILEDTHLLDDSGVVINDYEVVAEVVTDRVALPNNNDIHHDDDSSTPMSPTQVSFSSLLPESNTTIPPSPSPLPNPAVLKEHNQRATTPKTNTNRKHRAAAANDSKRSVTFSSHDAKSTSIPTEDKENQALPTINNNNNNDNPQSMSIKKPLGLKRDRSVRRGKWSLGTKIGTGSFGVVHMGMNHRTGQLMAAKIMELSSSLVKDIRSEVTLLKSLTHENIVRYLGAERQGRKLHIFQEWVPGGSLKTLLHKFGSFSLCVIRSYLFQILTGLAYLHENNIQHRDIKGGNVLVHD